MSESNGANETKAMWSASQSRGIVKRVVVTADLVLRSPARLGNGDADELTDMPLLIDAQSGRPLLQGTSLAGALRAHLQRVWPNCDDAALFGVRKGKDDGEQSALIVDDAYGENWGIEHRDGVKLDAATRTAEDGKLYEFDVWRTGTRFPIRLELLVRGTDEERSARLQEMLGTALNGLTNDGITLGGRKSRGLGMLTLEHSKVTVYDLRAPAGLLSWLRDDGKATDGLVTLGGRKQAAPDEMIVSLDMQLLDGGLLVRGNTGRDDVGADAVQLQTHVNNGEAVSLIPGTSLAGALRGRALRIARTLASSDAEADALVNGLFGIMTDGGGGTKKVSRVHVQEAILKDATTNYVQNRVSIDRFTGGALDTALFSEQPALPTKPEAGAQFNFRARRASDAERALLLLVVKDLCLGDLPIGGTISIGRGRLRARGGSICFNETSVAFKQDDKGRLTFTSGDAAMLNSLANIAALREMLSTAQGGK
jgi:CRISPR/Cas system CSM-associated protein Csm3 (group 7 of RAMP superfamily)